MKFMACILTFIVFAPIVILLCVLFLKICINPVYRRIASLILWFIMTSALLLLAHKEKDINISDETCVVLLSIWFFMLVAGVILTQVLHDGIFKRICGWIFIAVVVIPPLWLCFKLPAEGRYGRCFWLAISHRRTSTSRRMHRRPASKKEKREKSATVKNEPSTGKIRNL